MLSDRDKGVFFILTSDSPINKKGLCCMDLKRSLMLKATCEKQNIQSRQSAYGFVKHDICRLHNLLYHEGRSHNLDAWEENLWT